MIPRMVSVTGVKEWHEGVVRPVEDYLAGEEPLEIRVGDLPLSVTMRTPGHDLELATGFLFTEGLIAGRADLVSVGHEADAAQNGANRVRVELAEGVSFDPRGSQRNFYAASSCGVCGKASIEAVRVRNISPPNPDCTIDAEVLCRLPDRLRAQQQVFSRTGGLHAAGLFSLDGELQVLREDVGRHNAVDKTIGWALAAGLVPPDLGYSAAANPTLQLLQMICLAYFFAVYGITLWNWRRLDQGPRTLAWSVALVGALAWTLLPADSSDLLEYIGFGRLVAVYHVSPYLHTYSEFTDQFASYVTWDDPMPYGPVVLPLFALAGLVSEHHVFVAMYVIKLAWLLIHFLNAWLIYQIARSVTPDPRYALFVFGFRVLPVILVVCALAALLCLAASSQAARPT